MEYDLFRRLAVMCHVSCVMCHVFSMNGSFGERFVELYAARARGD
jgi:hypothetical protein